MFQQKCRYLAFVVLKEYHKKNRANETFLARDVAVKSSRGCFEHHKLKNKEILGWRQQTNNLDK